MMTMKEKCGFSRVSAFLRAGLFVLAACACASCATTSSNVDPALWRILPANARCTGEDPRFADRFNPDPLGRKFRVAFLKLVCQERFESETPEERTTQMMASHSIRAWMRFREQAAGSTAASALKQSPELEQSFRAALKSSRKADESIIRWNLSSKKIADPAAREFAGIRGDTGKINEELAARYPDLFSTDRDAFPLDVIVLMSYSPVSAPAATCFEAWLVGLPAHAVLADWREPGAYFHPQEEFVSPWDAIAAALFKLSDGQFEGLEPANPRDHDWLEEE